MLAKMFSGELAPGAKDEQGAYMIDRTPDYFKPILNYLRTRELVIDPKISKDGVLAEARYFGIQGLVDQIEKNSKAAEETTEHKLLLLKESFMCLNLMKQKNDDDVCDFRDKEKLRAKLESKLNNLVNDFEF